MPGSDVFISYSREDRSAAKYFAQCLEQAGFTVWWDAALHAGESFDQVIERELKAASAAIVLWSPRSVSSRWVRAEATLADRHGKLVPVIIENCERPIIFELTHTNDLSDWVGDNDDPRWKLLVQDLTRLVGQHTRKEPAVLAPAVGREPATVTPLAFASAAREVPAEPRPAFALNRYAEAEVDSQATQFTRGGDCLDICHSLEIGGGELPEQCFVVTEKGLMIGRAAPADMILSDRQVSRSHCRVELDGGVLRVTDLNSTNGTYINDKRIEGSATLTAGSVLQVGNVSLHHRVKTSQMPKGQRFASR